MTSGYGAAVESTLFGNTNGSWTWVSVAAPDRQADSGPVYVPVVKSPEYSQQVVLSNGTVKDMTVSVTGQSTDGKGKSDRRMVVPAGRSQSVSTGDARGRLAWFEVRLPDSSRVGWSLVAHRQIDCSTVDKLAVASVQGRNVTSAPRAEGKVAFTFDLQDDPVAAARVLDILKKEGVKSTFFVLADFARSNPRSSRGSSGTGTNWVTSRTYTVAAATRPTRSPVTSGRRTCWSLT